MNHDDYMRERKLESSKKKLPKYGQNTHTQCGGGGNILCYVTTLLWVVVRNLFFLNARKGVLLYEILYWMMRFWMISSCCLKFLLFNVWTEHIWFSDSIAVNGSVIALSGYIHINQCVNTFYIRLCITSDMDWAHCAFKSIISFFLCSVCEYTFKSTCITKQRRFCNEFWWDEGGSIFFYSGD